jgi:NAD(P)-dependent dehydrogenase (short-subunit alcohol dehydrogenase family)
MNNQQNIKDKTIIITGGSSGIGAAAARILSKMGARVVITGRSPETKKLADELQCDYYLVDYAKLEEVKKFAETVLAKYPRIDVLVNNVGGLLKERRVTVDGMEQTFQVNHLSGFLLTQLLQKRLEESNALVVNTSSMANNMGDTRYNDLQSEQKYIPMKAYGTAKLMNILHAMEINKRFSGVRAVSFHPGVVRTGFAREGTGLFKWAYETVIKDWFLISPEKGADTLIWFIAGEGFHQLKPGGYYDKRRPGIKSRQANDELARNLWDVSVKLIQNI